MILKFENTIIQFYNIILQNQFLENQSDAGGTRKHYFYSHQALLVAASYYQEPPKTTFCDIL